MKKFVILLLSLALTAYITFYKFYPYGVMPTINNSYDENKFMGKMADNETILYLTRFFIDPSFIPHRFIISNSTPIDIVIPIIEKDLSTVVQTVNTARAFVMHPINKIYFVGPNSSKIKQVAKELNCEFIDESTVLENFNYIMKKYGGWFVQQFLKLEASKFVDCDHYLVIDADTVYLRPQIFIEEQKYLVNVQWEPKVNRKIFTQQVLKDDKFYYYDFVTHQMLFSKKILNNLKMYVETLHGQPWDQVLFKLIDQDSQRGFSEYDIYQAFLTQHSGVKFKFISNANMSAPENFVHNIEFFKQAYAPNYKSINLHHSS